MTTLKESSAYPEGIVDVGIIAVACFKNPLKEHSINFLADILMQRKRAAIPITCIIGAYHITTKYLKASRIAVKKVLEGLLATRSAALYPQASIDIAIDAIEYAAHYNIESWDGYLIALAKAVGNSIIYTLDKELEKVKEVIVVNPFPEDAVKSYNEFLKEALSSKNL